MNCQMMRVISSPSSSTTGFLTLIFAMEGKAFAFAGRAPDGGDTRGRSGAAIAPPGKARYIARALQGILMPGAGTDRTKTAPALAGPIVVLVEPQLGENIGT